MKKILILTVLIISTLAISAQRDRIKDNTANDGLLNSKSLSALKWRAIGPAFASGRIADIAVHPDHEHTWYVAVGSGGVWKTTNSGTTWKSIFDGQSTYSTGCITIDPTNSHRIWLGTGENVGGRHVAWGDGIYLSEDDGKSWKNMGLKGTQHISKIIVHPKDANTIWVAAQGPLWNKGGERGLYMSTDGGKTWNNTLGDDEWMGVTDIAVDPRDANVLYAATWQRHRTVAAYMGGGPKSGLHKSMDGGKTWTKLSKGLPSGNMGKIGIAISPQKPDIIYAAIELDRTKGGVYKSTDMGASWKKQSDAVSGATGPHYYQELYASPHEFDKLYLMDVRIQVSEDGGKSFSRLPERDKHSDNHAIVFRPDDPNYLMIGTDAGIYESHDNAANWRFINNLPLTQYYKVAVDDQEPFYYVYGGTQDNGSHSGPSRTTERDGIRNAHWYKTLGADGHQSATEPGNPNIFYAETQQGGMNRIDRLTGETIFIQPQAGEGEDYERYNWDAPIVVSPHNPARLYFASQRVLRSDDRGDSWTAISDDLTKNQERIELPIMGRVQSWDSPWDVGAMSNYNTISSLSESPVEQGLIYAGTDDGIVQVTEDGGGTWRKIMVSSMPGVPATAFVNDLRADLHDANTVYIALDNHKYGDFKPYLLKSTDRGRTWQSANSGLKDGNLVWRTVQDHVSPNLMFAATERGVFVSLDGAGSWMKFSGGLPTISLRDITIQRRENDLVAASFGRGFFILDDYSALRQMTTSSLAEVAALYPVKDALQYNQRSLIGNQGAGIYEASNPPYGATFTYHINDDVSAMKSQRKKKEKALNKTNSDVPFPGWDSLLKEQEEEMPKLWFTITDNNGQIVNRLERPYKKGIQRTTWNLSHISKSGISLQNRGGGGGGWRSRGYQVVPGTYTVAMSKEHNGEVAALGSPQSFAVKSIIKGALPTQPIADIHDFRMELNDMRGAMSAVSYNMNHATQKISAMKTALMRTTGDTRSTLKDIHETASVLKKLGIRLNGHPVKDEIGERSNPSLQSRFSIANRGSSSSYGPTKLHREQLMLAKKEFGMIKGKLDDIMTKIGSIEQSLIKMGAPYIMGQAIPEISGN
ncbi:MAG: glycosyl hydrolase [Bacteroidia bacterium]|nr:glycosyl hydrolase [Bacteroidia bacterium]